MEPTAAIEAIAEELQDELSIRALFLSGSYGAGLEDAYSDIDFLMVASDGPTDEVAKLWRKAVSRTGKIVLWRDRQVRPVLINAITEDWLRTDVVILKPDQMGKQTKEILKVLFDHDGIFDALPASSKKTGPDPRRTKYQFVFWASYRSRWAGWNISMASWACSTCAIFSWTFLSRKPERPIGAVRYT